MTPAAQALLDALQAVANPDKVPILARFFKTGAGQYGEGDVFWGITVPLQRKVATAHYKDMTPDDCAALLVHPVHEVRLTALIVLTMQFTKLKSPDRCAEIYRIYLAHTDYINHWDLVDLTAPIIVGGYLDGQSHAPLFELAAADHLWKNRIAMLATFHFIRKKDFTTAFQIAEILLHHPHDLIHKAVGWMLREIGERDHAAEVAFLLPRYKIMPRTMLRYAIEKFPEPLRQQFLKGAI